jgi:hypothetical protein
MKTLDATIDTYSTHSYKPTWLVLLLTDFSCTSVAEEEEAKERKRERERERNLEYVQQPTARLRAYIRDQARRLGRTGGQRKIGGIMGCQMKMKMPN